MGVLKPSPKAAYERAVKHFLLLVVVPNLVAAQPQIKRKKEKNRHCGLFYTTH